MIVFRTDMLRKGIVIHETTHAIDDMLAPDDPDKSKEPEILSRKDPEIKKLYEEFMQRVKVDPKADWSDMNYAQTDAGEYLAMASEMYYGGEYTKEILRKADPGIFNYVRKMMNDKN